MIVAKNVSKTYQIPSGSVSAVHDISLEIAEAETVALLGRSGSGKTTLLNLLAGLDRVTSGTLTVNGVELSRCRKSEVDRFRRSSVGVVFQQFRLVQHRSAFQNVELPLVIAGVPARKRRLQVGELLEKVGLADRAKHKPSELSGGQQQRVAIARAIVNAPKVLMADEPTGNLDSQHATEVLSLLVDLCKEKQTTLVLVTHDEQLAKEYTRRIVRLDDGKIKEDVRLKSSNAGSELSA